MAFNYRHSPLYIEIHRTGNLSVVIPDSWPHLLLSLALSLSISCWRPPNWYWKATNNLNLACRILAQLLLPWLRFSNRAQRSIYFPIIIMFWADPLDNNKWIIVIDATFTGFWWAQQKQLYCKCKVKADLAVVITSVEGVMSMPSFLTQAIRKRKQWGRRRRRTWLITRCVNATPARPL